MTRIFVHGLNAKLQTHASSKSKGTDYVLGSCDTLLSTRSVTTPTNAARPGFLCFVRKRIYFRANYVCAKILKMTVKFQVAVLYNDKG